MYGWDIFWLREDIEEKWSLMMEIEYIECVFFFYVVFKKLSSYGNYGKELKDNIL